MERGEKERKALENGLTLICGVDEAGRGPLAGPVYAAACILKEGYDLPGLNDSKKLTEKKRDLLFEQVKENCICYCVASASEDEIDAYNILRATHLAMRRAVEGLALTPELVLVDGNSDPSIGLPTECVIKGDAKEASIAAASILAKVSRDRYMLELAREYPQYQFEKHKGYPTKLHYQCLDTYGISQVHRLSFLKKYLRGKETGE